MRVPRLLMVAASIVLLMSLAIAAEPAKGTSATAAAPATSTAATVLSAMDGSVQPCQDFYRYACGGWLDKTPLPADQSRWGRGFAEITERNRQALRGILEASAKEQGGTPERAKLGAFYAACMDEEAVEKVGAEPLKPLLEAINGVEDPVSVMVVAAKLHGLRVPVLFRMGAQGDFKNPDFAIAVFSQGGLGLPDRDYYLKDDDRSKQTRADYQAHVTRMFQLLGEPEEAAKKHAAQVFGFELELAKVSRPRAELRDPNKTYNKIDLDGLKKLAPALDWTRFLASTGYPSVKDINVGVPEFFQGLEKQVTSADPETLRAYLRWHLLRATSPLLSKAFVDESFDFYGRKLSGQKEQQARWKRCVEATDQSLGELLGPEFVKLYFPGDSKAIAQDLIARVEAAFESDLPNLTWMDDATRARASAKLKALKNQIGYPDKWRDYSKLAVKKGDWFGNGMAARRFAFEFEANKIGKPVDKGEWGMTPPTVNAYYSANLNQMVFPAGILQPPFFDRSFPMAMNFGGIGMVMGHELTHGFDDQGRKFDPTGKLSEWWEPSVSAKFEERAKCVSDLYSTYEVQPGVKLNGKLTLGENIADLGGIKQAYVAYKKWAAEHPELDKPVVPGLTNDQLFFVGFGQTWCTIQTPESERMLATTDPHSHARYRVIGPLSNSPAFSSAFQCADGAPMKRKDACEVW